MSEGLLTHKDLAVMLGVSETTVKSYRRKFPGCIPVANNGKPIRFKKEAAEVCFRIRDLFSTGMSVEEVGARLTEEFGWRRPKGAAAAGGVRKAQAGGGAGGVGGDLSQSFATALGNMAKSMISLNQTQSSILSYMKKLETIFSDMGLSGIQQIDAESIAAERKKNEASAQESLARLDQLVLKMTEAVEASGGALEEARALRQEQQRENAAIMQNMQNLSAEVQALAQSGLQGANSGQPSKVVQLYPQRQNGLAAGPGSGQMQTGGAYPAGADSAEIPRHILHLPLVVRLEDGSYISAGGKSLGRISLNDVKAILAQSYLPPENFSLRLERFQGDILVTLEQADSQNPDRVLLTFNVAEITSSKGLGVLEIRNYTQNEAPVHPVEFCRFVSGIGKQ